MVLLFNKFDLIWFDDIPSVWAILIEKIHNILASFRSSLKLDAASVCLFLLKYKPECSEWIQQIVCICNEIKQNASFI